MVATSTARKIINFIVSDKSLAWLSLTNLADWPILPNLGHPKPNLVFYIYIYIYMYVFADILNKIVTKL